MTPDIGKTTPVQHHHELEPRRGDEFSATRKRASHGKPITILIPGITLMKNRKSLLLPGGRTSGVDYETRRIRDGKIIDISLTVSPVKDSRAQYWRASKIARGILT
jgi:hypothetical protein